MKNILLLTDFSENAFNALAYALHLFKDNKCEFFILNVQKTSNYITADLINTSSDESLYSHIINDHKAQLTEIINRLKTISNHVHSITPLVAFDDFTTAVNKVVNARRIELIVMGTNGATGAKEVILGSNALQVIRNLTCPVIVVPEGFKFKGIHNSMFCMEYRKDFDEGSLRPFIDLLNIHQPQLHIIEINNKVEGDIKDRTIGKEKLLQKFSDFPCHYYSINQLPVWMVIQTATQLLKNDLNAVFVEKETFLERLFSGSEISTLTYETRVPLLFLTLQ